LRRQLEVGRRRQIGAGKVARPRRAVKWQAVGAQNM
jgi:hypothetical protein